MAIRNTALSSSNQTIYPSTGDNAVTTIIVCNIASFDPEFPTTGQAYLYLYAVPSADVSGDTTLNRHTIINGLPIPAGETVSLDQEKMVLATGDKLIAKGDAINGTNLVVTVSTLAV